MDVRQFDLENAPRPAAGKPDQRAGKDGRADMQASPPGGDDDDQRAGETIEEPGYGHGV